MGAITQLINFLNMTDLNELNEESTSKLDEPFTTTANDGE